MGIACSNSPNRDVSDGSDHLRSSGGFGSFFRASPSSISKMQSDSCGKESGRNVESIRSSSNPPLSRSATAPALKLERRQSRRNLYDTNEEITTTSDTRSRANYGSVRERLLKWTPSSYHCRLFCGGATCKYCDSNAFLDSHAVPGLYSTWVTDNIMACARPTMITIQRFDLFRSLKNQNIVSVINLQRPYEHSQCGPPFPSKLEFTYDPEDFMKEKFFHYNFGWPDFGASTVACLLDMVKVLAFALIQGKVLVHCHAGLGRTGVLICAFLMWDRNYTPTEAIQFVRNKRPGSVQTSPQVELLMEFDDFLRSLKPVFISDLTFEEYLKNQQLTLHGMETRLLKHIPKMVFVCCERLLELAGVNQTGTLKEKLCQLLRYENPDQIASHTIPKNRFDHLHRHSIDLEHGFQRSFSDATSVPRIDQQIKRKHLLKQHSESKMITDRLPPIILGDRSLMLREFNERESTQNGVESNKIDGVVVPDREKWRYVFDSVLDFNCATTEEIQRLKVKLIENSFSSRWNCLAEETSSENLLTLMRDWFNSLKEAPIPADFPFDPFNGKMQNLPKSVKCTLLYMAKTFNRISSRDCDLINRCARYLTQCLTRNATSTAENWFLGAIERIGEMNGSIAK